MPPEQSVPVIADRVVAITLGRGGSKGLPGKNIRPLAGRPLIAWSVAAGLAASSVHRVICSTDDAEIAGAAAAWGAEIPFLRPAALATDAATDLDVFRHALSYLLEAEGALPEFVVQLRPTTPFRDPAWIDEAVRRMREDRLITCVRSVTEAPHTPYKMWCIEEGVGRGRLRPLLALEGCAEPFNLPRQALPPVYWHTGQIDVVRSTTVLAGSMTGPEIEALMVPADTAIDIDSLSDLMFADLRFHDLMPAALARSASGREAVRDPSLAYAGGKG